MRLIDADALRKDLFVAITTQKRWMDGAQKSNSGTLFQLAQQAYFTLLECKQHLEKAPTIETPTQPQLIHCKDCKYYHSHYCGIWSQYGTIRTKEDGYCYMAERATE